MSERAGELAQRVAIAALEQRAALAASKANDPFWRTSGGANVQRWVERAYHCALSEVQQRKPEPGRNARAYLDEVAAQVRSYRDDGPDLDDEAWWSSAIEEAAALIGDVARRFAGPWVGGHIVANLGGPSFRRGDVIITRVEEELIARRANREIVRVRFDTSRSNLLVSPDGMTAFAHDRHYLRHVDMAKGTVTSLPCARGDSYKIAFSATSIAVGGSNDDVVRRYSWAGEALAPVFLDHPSSIPDDAESDYFGVCDLALSPDGTMLAVNESGEHEYNTKGDVEFLSESATRLYDLERGISRARIPGGFYRGGLVFAGNERLVTPSEILTTRDLSAVARFGHAFTTGVSIPGTSWVVMWWKPRLIVYDSITGEQVIDLAETLAPDDPWGEPNLFDLYVDPEGHEISASLWSDVRVWLRNESG